MLCSLHCALLALQDLAVLVAHLYLKPDLSCSPTLLPCNRLFTLVFFFFHYFGFFRFHI